MDYSENERKASRCLQCGEEIIYGRSDKKFCCEECKNRYHNRQSNAGRAFRTRVNGLLNRNYEILDACLSQGKDSLELMEAVSLGFSPYFATSFSKVRTRVELACYDIRYFMSENRIFAIKKIRNVSLNLHKQIKTNGNEY